MSARSKPAYDYRTDERLLQVARETGYPVSEVYSRGVKFCRDNPRGKNGDFQFDQTLPDFEPVRRVDLEDADTPADMLAQTRPPAGYVDMDQSAEIVPAGRDHDGTPRFLRQDGSLLAHVSAGELHSLTLRREPARGGIVVSMRIDGVEVMRSAVMPDEEADHREPEHRAALNAYAAARG